MSSEQAPNQKHGEEGEQPFHRAARFSGERTSRKAYLAAERGIAEASADISAYRFQLSRIWHVAVVAEQAPEAGLQQVIEDALRPGERVALPAQVLAVLLNRHREVMRHRLPWVEGHYHPGRRFPLP